MPKSSPLSLGEKIKYLRTAKGVSQENMARITKSSQSTIHRLEQGHAECDADMLATIKKFLEIEDAPLLEHETSVYKHRLHDWGNMITGNRIADANKMQDKLSVILDLPYEHGLCMMFLMWKAQLLTAEHKLLQAEEVMLSADPYMANACDESMCVYYYNMGAIAVYKGDKKNALKHYLRSLDITTDPNSQSVTKALSRIGILYLEMGKPVQAMLYLERAYRKSDNHTTLLKSQVCTMLATTYLCLGQYSKAKELFDVSLVQTESTNNKTAIALAMSNNSLYNIKVGNYEVGLQLSNQAIKSIQEIDKDNKDITISNQGLGANPMYMLALYNKGLALLKMKEFEQCQEVIEKGQALSEDNEKIAIMFNTLGHLITINESASQEYVENVTIPYFTDSDGLERFFALDMCKELEAYYKKKRAKTKANAIATVAKDIYEGMFTGELDL